jgi:hypothetical protein
MAVQVVVTSNARRAWAVLHILVAQPQADILKAVILVIITKHIRRPVQVAQVVTLVDTEVQMDALELLSLQNIINREKHGV